MNLISLKEGMLVRDLDKLVEIVRVREHSATGVVVLRDLDKPGGEGQWITYSAEGVWSFLSTPTDKQIAAITAIRSGSNCSKKSVFAARDESAALAAVRATLQGQGMLDLDIADGEPKPGDRVSWMKDKYIRIHGLFLKKVRGYYVCVTLGTQRRVALKPGDVSWECG